jgi:hypothetical protein
MKLQQRLLTTGSALQFDFTAIFTLLRSQRRTFMFKGLLVFSFVLIFSAVALGQNKSIYTSLAAKKCKTLDVNKGMAGNYSGRCAGVGGYQLDVYLDDERNSVGLVFPSKRVVGLDLWNHFGGFSELGETAEWRMKGKQPVALIVRLKVSDRGEGKPPTSYLIVSKIDYIDACVTDIVKPGKSQNASAQRLADAASTRPCKKTE